MRTLLLASLVPLLLAAAPQQQSPSGITHAFLATGAQTCIVMPDNSIAWRYPAATRDGWVLPSGHILLAVAKSKTYPSGAIVELDRNSKVLFEFKGSQSEVDCIEPLPDGHLLLTESGQNPRLLEIDHQGKILIQFPLQCQRDNFHMQTRMARKLPNGNYLVPHLLDKAVREYTPEGKVVWQFQTPENPKEAWPFTAIRLDNGNTLINCTHGNMTLEINPAGKIVWQLTNADLPQPLISDACGAQRLPNGNTVIASYGAGRPDQVKLLEVTPDKKVVWTYHSGQSGGIHEVQILDADGKPFESRQLR